ncbi:glycosyl transferase family 1 [Methanocella sp. CWC-04]|uniref:Glycosyl transferase family 1 n=1 Tax=Methanooceanicella nereidis TaxID=2052831 RepID=A0AAP2W774_9EURY|nr:glycosyltransferase family 4 protein [Methanocella sp. CWC-04]MCD1296113.1 glycosyl transferase family 1 [Methanocella sp. CWC-04]
METLKFCVATYKMLKGNGIGVAVALFAQELARYHNVTLATVSADISIPGITIQKYPANNPLKMKQTASDIQSQKFDFISTHFPPFDRVASMTDIPHLLHDPGIPPLSLQLKPYDLGFWSAVNLSRLLSARKASVVLPISDYMGNEFRKKYNYSGKMQVLPYGLKFPDDIKAPVDDQFGKYVLYVGRHTPYKGVHTLIEIFGEVKKELGDDVHLVTIGNYQGNYGGRLRSLADRIGNVHLLGYVEDIWPYYAGASVYATCSGWEGQDLPVIEAQYMGKPVVSFNNCSHPEVVRHGMLARDRNEFKEALVNYLSSDHTEMSYRKKMLENYSIEQTVKNFIEIARGVV